MTECCVYFVVQVKSRGHWVEVGISDKSLSIVNNMLRAYLSINGPHETRIMQRSIKEDRNKGKKTPKCC